VLPVIISGTEFLQDVTTVDFGPEITIEKLTFRSATSIEASIKLAPAAVPGARTVTITNAAPGGGTATLPNAFTITTGPATSAEGSLGVIPDDYVLQEAYPNPFNPSTRIRYGIPEESRVKLEVHNMLGNVVTTLIDGVRSQGLYELQWRADNLPSGVYLIRINAESLTSTRHFIASRKVVFVK
jgi:hypothetical protein